MHDTDSVLHIISVHPDQIDILTTSVPGLTFSLHSCTLLMLVPVPHHVGINLGVCPAPIYIYTAPVELLGRELASGYVAANSLANEGRVTGARVQRCQRGRGIVPHTLVHSCTVRPYFLWILFAG